MEPNKNQILEKLKELKQVLPEDFRTIILALETVIKAEFSTCDPTEDPPIKTKLAINKTEKTKEIPYRNSIDEALNSQVKPVEDIYNIAIGMSMTLNRYEDAPEHYEIYLTIHLINQLANLIYNKMPKCLKIIKA